MAKEAISTIEDRLYKDHRALTEVAKYQHKWCSENPEKACNDIACKMGRTAANTIMGRSTYSECKLSPNQDW